MHLKFKDWEVTLYKDTLKLYGKKILKQFGIDLPISLKLRRKVKVVVRSIVDIQKLDITCINEKDIKYLSDMYLSHRFDLLGSGWKCVNSREKNGLSYSNTYHKIDWHRDYISGHDLSKVLEWDKVPRGADIKTIWELARMQHLLQLSIFSIKNIDIRLKAVKEFRNVLEDFIAHNKFAKGVNWTSAMDVSIRCINMLLSYDIFRQLDIYNILDDNFQRVFIDFVYKHERFILQNLEIDLLHGRNNNHYLSNLLGLLIIETYLSVDKKIWSFAYKELLIEADKQYYKEGSNIEGSLSYHRLSTEIIVLAAAFIGRREAKIPRCLIEILNRASFFSYHMTKLNGRVVQFGDSDNGRIIKISPQGCYISGREALKRYLNINEFQDKEYFDEDFLNHKTLLAEIGGVVKNNVTDNAAKEYPLEYSFIKAVSKLKPKIYEEPALFDRVACCNDEKICEFKYHIITEISIENLDFRLDTGVWKGYPDFGVFFYNTNAYNIYLKTGRKSKKLTGHIHDDILHIEMNVGGEDIFSDPGTFVYTANRKERDKFRSCIAHTAPIHKETKCIFKNIFQVIDLAECTVLQMDKNDISVLMVKEELKHYRSIHIEENVITILDKSNQPFELNLKRYPFFSGGYGRLEKVFTSNLVKITSKNLVRGTV